MISCVLLAKHRGWALTSEAPHMLEQLDLLYTIETMDEFQHRRAAFYSRHSNAELRGEELDVLTS